MTIRGLDAWIERPDEPWPSVDDEELTDDEEEGRDDAAEDGADLDTYGDAD